MKTMIVLSLFAVAYFAVGFASAVQPPVPQAIDPIQIDTPAGTFYLMHNDYFNVGVAQETNGCAGVQYADNDPACPEGTPADTIFFDHDFA